MGKDAFYCTGLVWCVYNEVLNINIFEQGIGLSTTTMIMTSNYGKLTILEENSLNKNVDLIKESDIFS